MLCPILSLLRHFMTIPRNPICIPSSLEDLPISTPSPSIWQATHLLSTGSMYPSSSLRVSLSTSRFQQETPLLFYSPFVGDQHF